MSYRPWLLISTMASISPAMASTGFEPGLSFPLEKEYACSSTGKVGAEQAREVLEQLLQNLNVDHKQASQYLFINQVSGFNSHHFLFTLQKDNVPVHGQDVILSLNDQCELFRYQYQVDLPLNPPEASGSVVTSADEAVSQTKLQLDTERSPISGLIKLRSSLLTMRSEDGETHTLTVERDAITAIPIYRWIKGQLVLGYYVTVPLNGPQGNLEMFISSVDGRASGFYYQAKIANSTPLVSPLEFKWLGYGDDPSEQLGNLFTPSFWTEQPGQVPKILPLKSLSEPESSYTQFYSNQDFHWWGHSLNADYAQFWNAASEVSRYQIPAILTNMQAIHDGFSYAAETLSYDFIGEHKVGLMLTDSDIRFDKYLPDFDLIAVGKSDCLGPTYDPAITYHEQGHALFRRLKLQGAPVGMAITPINGAINEAFADYWASTQLSHNSDWNELLGNLRLDLCGKAVRDYNAPEQDYFAGYETNVSSAHSKVSSEYGTVATETLLAAPLYRARKAIAQNAFLNNDIELVNRYGEDPAAALADQIVLEAFLGLSMHQQYQETAFAVYQSAKRLDATGIAAAVFRQQLTNVNLLPRDVSPESRTAFVSPQTQSADVAIISRDESEANTKVELALNDLPATIVDLEPGKKQQEWLAAPAMQCFQFNTASLKLTHTLSDNSVVQKRDYDMALVGGNTLLSLAGREVERYQWHFTLPDTINNNANQRLLVRTKGNGGAYVEMQRIGHSDVVRLNRMTDHLGRVWYSQTEPVTLSDGDWQINNSNISQADLYLLECIPEFNIQIRGELKENSRIQATAMHGFDLLDNVQWQIVGLPESKMSGNTFSYTLPNWKQSQDITLEATLDFSGASRMASKTVTVNAVNDPASFTLQVPAQSNESENVTFKVAELSDAEGIDTLQTLWLVDGEIIGEGETVQWMTPSVATDTRFQVTVKVIDRDDVSSVTEKQAEIMVNHVNRAPTIALQGKSVKQGETLILIPVLSDEDHEVADLKLTWTVTTGEGQQTFQTQTLNYPVAADHVGNIDVEVVVSDGLAQANASATIPVIAVNKAPQLALMGADSAQADSWVKVVAEVQDETPDDVILNWQVTPGIEWQRTGPSTIRVRTPKTSKPGAIDVQVTADDGEFSVSAHHNIRWDAYLNAAPEVQIDGVHHAAFGQRVSLTAVAYDDDNWPQPLSYTWRQESGPESQFMASGNVLNFNVSENMANAKLVFVATVSDGQNQSSVKHAVSIGAVPKPAIVVKPFEKTRGELETITLDASESLPARGKALSYQWKQVSGPALVDFDSQTARARFTLPEVNKNGVIELELTVLEDGETSSQRFTIEVRNRGPKARPVTAPIHVEVDQTDEQTSLVTIDAASIVELEEDVDYQYFWRKTQGAEVTWVERESRYLKVRLAGSDAQRLRRAQQDDASLVQLLGFELDLTTPEQGVRTYGVEVEVTQTAQSDDTDTPAQPKPPVITDTPVSSGGGGGGGSLGVGSLLALLLLRRRKK